MKEIFEFDKTLTIDKPMKDWEIEWQDMPEFNNQGNQFTQIVVHFKEEEDVEEFSKLLDQKITDKTKSIWFPKPGKKASLRYKSIEK
jgi:hypothetical protein